MGKKSIIRLRLGQVCIGVRSPKCRRVPHSPNSLNSMHWGTKAAWKKAWEEEVFYAWQYIKPQYKDRLKYLPYSKCLITIYVFSIHPQDEDNANASMKGIIDGIVKVGLIEDDDYYRTKVLVKHVPVKTRDVEHVEVTIEKRL